MSRQYAQPPAGVSLLEPGEIWPSPQPLLPSPSRTSINNGSNA
jgi:hypothetical protein